MSLENSLEGLLLRYIQVYSNTAVIHTLNHFDKNILSKIEIERKKDTDLECFYKEIKKGLQNHNLTIPQHIGLFNLYSEAEVYLYLKERVNSIERIPKKSSPTPDFKCSVKIKKGNSLTGEVESLEFNIELKTFGLYQSESNMEGMLEDSLNSNIRLEERLGDLKKGLRFSRGKRTCIIFEERVISTLKKVPCDKSISISISTLIDKMESNYKEEQFKNGLTIPLYNISLLNLPIKEEDLSPVLCERENVRSGILWNAAFGKLGNIIYGYEEFEGKGNMGGCQTREGFLRSRKDVAACVFFCNKSFWGDSPASYGLYCSKYNKNGINDTNLEAILWCLTNGVYNTDRNGRDYKYKV